MFDPSKGVNELLISGMISAISSFMCEALGIKSQLKEINTGDHYILLDLRDKIGVFIVTNTSSRTLKIALEKFTNFFETEFAKYLEKKVVDLDDFKTAASAVEKYFGFLPGAWKYQ